MITLCRLAFIVLLASCAWDLEPPEGPRSGDAGVTGDGSIACGSLGAVCCAGSRCMTGLVCNGATCATATCTPLLSACSSAPNCCGRLSCRARIAATPRCCLEVDQPCAEGRDTCCGGMSCVDLGSGARCICGQRGIQCVTDADCCSGLRCVLRFPTNPASGGDCS